MPTRRVKPSERRRCARACHSCKRRKERCDGHQPCKRCVQRSIGHQCTFVDSPPSGLPSPELSIDVPGGSVRCRRRGSLSPAVGFARLIPDGRGKFMFIGDAANLSFLQIIRRLVGQSLGPCDFIDDPLRHRIVEATQTSRQTWILDMARHPPRVPEPSETAYLLWWYTYATNCVLNLFDEAELHRNFQQWRRTPQKRISEEPMSAIFFLIFAIGAQTCPEDRDEAAEKYFNYGRLLTTASGLMEEPSLSTVTANILLTMYLLAASRRNAAFVTLGTAVRAALALGIHRYEINELFGTSEFTTRERLWKVLRVLDLFMSASLGRPPSTHETRNTKAGTNYSASNDLCAIFENILTDVYSGRTVTPEVLGRISGDHREWAQKFTTGLAVDDIRPGEFIGTHQGRRIPNVGLLHLKEAYYWTIMLLTRPFLVESVNSHFSHSVGDSGLAKDTAPTPTSPSNYILAQACVDSAIRTVDLLHGLMSAEEVPKRLPFVVNSLFVAALVLGLAQFANKDQSFPLEKSFARARDLLGRFGRNDTVAKRNHAVVEKLRAACNLYLEQRTRRKMEKNSQRIGGLFGTVHDDYLSKAPPPGRATPPPAPREAVAPSLDLSLPFNNTEFAISSSSTIPEGAPHPIELGAGSLEIELLPDFAAMTDLSIPMSPSTFLFEKYDGIDSLFSTVDSSLFASEESGFLGEGFTR